MKYTSLINIQKALACANSTMSTGVAQVFDYNAEGLDMAGVGYSKNSDRLFIVFMGKPADALLVHELKHLFDFETGNFSFSDNDNGAPFYDASDEIFAYERQALLYNTTPWDDNLAKTEEYRHIQQTPSGINSAMPYIGKYYPHLFLQQMARQQKAIIRYHGKTYR